MATQQKSGNITIANIVSIVGAVLLMLFTFMGHSYKSGGELGWDIMISIGITGFTVFLLYISEIHNESHYPKIKVSERPHSYLEALGANKILFLSNF